MHGDLNNQGNCAVPQSIDAGLFYECSFSADVNGNAGESETDTVTATAEDDETSTVQAEGSATVAIDEPALFADGFEPGNLTAWSARAP